MKMPSAELLAEINELNIRLYGLTSGKVVIGEVLQNYENGVELNYAATVSADDEYGIRFAPAAHGENVPTIAIIYSDCIEYESIATLRLKKYYLDYLTVSKISGYTTEDISEPEIVHQPLDPKGYAEDYWNKIAALLAAECT